MFYNSPLTLIGFPLPTIHFSDRLKGKGDVVSTQTLHGMSKDANIRIVDESFKIVQQTTIPRNYMNKKHSRMKVCTVKTLSHLPALTHTSIHRCKKYNKFQMYNHPTANARLSIDLLYI